MVNVIDVKSIALSPLEIAHDASLPVTHHLCGRDSTNKLKGILELSLIAQSCFAPFNGLAPERIVVLPYQIRYAIGVIQIYLPLHLP